MNKYFQGQLRVHLTDFFDLFEGTLTGKHHEFASEIARELHTGGAGDRHLRRGVNRKIRRKAANETADANILDDDCVRAGGNDRTEVFLRFGEFVRKNQSVKSDVALHAAAMEKVHEPRQIGIGKIVSAHAGIEALQTEVDRVGAVLDSSPGAVPIAGGREQFGDGARGH